MGRRTDWTIPSSNAPTMVAPNDDNPPRSAAARAGTMNNVYVDGLRTLIGATRIPASAPSTDAATQLVAATSSGR